MKMKNTFLLYLQNILFAFLLLPNLAAANPDRFLLHITNGDSRNNGYESAGVTIDYQISVCNEGKIVIAVHRVPNTTQASDAYFYNGTRYRVDSPPPKNTSASFTGQVISGGTTIGQFRFNDIVENNHMGCMSANTYEVGNIKNHIKPGATPEEIKTFEKGLSVGHISSSRTLVYAQTEEWIKAQIRKAAQAKDEQEKAAQVAQQKQQSEKSGTPAGSTASNSQNTTTDEWGRVIGANAASEQSTGTNADNRASSTKSTTSSQPKSQHSQSTATPDVHQQIRAEQARREAYIEKQNLAVDRAISDVGTSYYQMHAAKNARENINSLSKMSGDYNSIAEIEADYHRRIQAINIEKNNWEQTNAQQVQTLQSMYFGGGSQADQAFGEVLGSAMALAAQNAREKAAREAKNELRMEQERMVRELEQKRQEAENRRQAALKAALLNSRKRLLESYPEGHVPLSSEDVPTETLYYFSYIADKNALDKDNPPLIITNTFPIYKQGTWPFKFAINREINTLQQGQNTLVGFYTTENLANEMRENLVRIARETKFSVREITYPGPNPNAKPDSAPSETFSVSGSVTEHDKEDWGSSPKSKVGIDEWGKAKSNRHQQDFW